MAGYCRWEISKKNYFRNNVFLKKKKKLNLFSDKYILEKCFGKMYFRKNVFLENIALYSSF